MRPFEHHRKPAAPVELGSEPPLVVGDDDPARYTRRGVSLRWLFGALTTAVTSVALMGGAIIAALDGRYVVNAEAAVAPLARSSAPKAAKADKVTPEFQDVSSRRVIEVGTVVRQGDDNIIAQRPYALVSASLVLDRDEIGDVPPFDARELAVRKPPSEQGVTDAIYDKPVDGEITVSVSSFPLDDSGALFDDGIILDELEIERQLREEQFLEGGQPIGDTEGFVDVATGKPANVTIVPENVSELIKTSDSDDADDAGSELIELVQPGDTLKKIMRGSGIETADIEAIDEILRPLGVARLKAGQILRIAFLLEESETETTRRPSRFSIYEGSNHVATVAMADTGDFILGEAPSGPAPELQDSQVVVSRGRLPTIYRSLYQTATNHDLPASVRDSLLATFSLDVDFNAQVRPGDRLTVLYSQTDTEEEGPPEILFAALTAAGVDRRFYRFKSQDGSVDFFDEEGRTGDKFLLRKPMARGVFRSGFGMRRHPILRRRRMHKGVDWAAPRGTRIYAAGDGVIHQAGWKAGYGRWVSIRHKNGYVTGYAHQSRIAKGIKRGVPVKQGQVIGYVGSTGFSTGPHLHYEVMVNGRHVNPLKIRLRRGRELSGQALEEFKAERDRIDKLLATEEVTVASSR